MPGKERPSAFEETVTRGTGSKRAGRALHHEGVHGAGRGHAGRCLTDSGNPGKENCRLSL